MDNAFCVPPLVDPIGHPDDELVAVYQARLNTSMVKKGVAPALAETDAANGMINTGVDVVTAETLKAYEEALDARGIPHE